MKKTLLFSSLVTTLAFVASAQALQLTSPAFKNGGQFPYEYGYCQPNGQGQIKASDDISPALRWSGAPIGTKSFALILYDPDNPDVSYFDAPNRMIALGVKRSHFYHWVLVNIPENVRYLPEKAGSSGFVPGGKKPGQTLYGLMGINSYTIAFNNPAFEPRITFPTQRGENMRGVYGRYDGPCAPWNDEKIHGYTFMLYALNVRKLNLPSNGHFTGAQALRAMKGHVIETATLVGNFITNPALMRGSN